MQVKADHLQTHKKKFSEDNLSLIRKMLVTPAVRYYFMPTKVTVIIILESNKCCSGHEEIEACLHC